MAFQIACVGVNKRFGPQTVLDQVAWRVSAGAISGLVGVSGAGKTTLLRIIAGLETCSAGRVEMSSDNSPAQAAQAKVGMVFQDLGLWPHLTARRHLETVLGSLGRRARRERAEALLAEVRLARDAWDRPPAELSGGEGQRLALARALAPSPDVLLLDEPLAQVDPALRGELMSIVRQAVEARQMTAVFVSHSWSEAADLCGRIAVLAGGRIQQEGTPEEVFWKPANAAVSRLTGPVAEVPRRLVQDGSVGWRCGTLPEATDDGLLVVRPQQVRWIGPDGANCWSVRSCVPRGAGWLVTLESDGRSLVLASARAAQLGASVGIEVIPPAPDGRL